MVSLRQFIDISECQEVLAAVTEAQSVLFRTLDESVVDVAEPAAALLVHRRLERLRSCIDSAVSSGAVAKIGVHVTAAREVAMHYHDDAAKAVERVQHELENTSVALQDVPRDARSRERHRPGRGGARVQRARVAAHVARSK